MILIRDSFVFLFYYYLGYECLYVHFFFTDKDKTWLDCIFWVNDSEEQSKIAFSGFGRLSDKITVSLRMHEVTNGYGVLLMWVKRLRNN